MKEKGFTLIELMIVVAIVSILLALGIGMFAGRGEVDEDASPGDVNEEVQ